MTETTRAYVNVKLLEKARGKFPETKGLTYSALIDFLIRKALEA